VPTKITFAFDEETLKAGRDYARRHQTTLNHLVRDLVRKTAVADRRTALAEMFRLMDAHAGHSRGKTWRRDELQAPFKG
jgi:hypothetical protein